MRTPHRAIINGFGPFTLLIDEKYNIGRLTLGEYAYRDYLRNIDHFTIWDVLFVMFIMIAVGLEMLLLTLDDLYYAIVIGEYIAGVIFVWVVYQFVKNTHIDFNPDDSFFMLDYDPIP